MPLPQRLAPFLESLRSLAFEPPLRDFSLEARELYLEEGYEVEEGDVGELTDYIVFLHVDEDGRSFLDHYLAAHGDALAPEDKEVVEGLRRSIYGVFDVVGVEPGVGFTLLGHDSEGRFEILAETSSLRLHEDDRVLARVVPYRGRYEVTESLQVLPPDPALAGEWLSQQGDRHGLEPAAIGDDTVSRWAGIVGDSMETEDVDPMDDDEPVEPILRQEHKVGRNDPCPCGSGKKHKKCCGRGG